jgi:shikimate kinase
MVTHLNRIVGDPGIGKSTVYEEFRQRDIPASDIDRDGLAMPFNITTGEVTDTIGDTAEWHSQHGWKLNEEKIDSIRVATDAEVTFVCGTVTDDGDLQHKFNKFFALFGDEELVRHRLRTREGNTYGKTQKIEDLVVANMARRKALYHYLGAIFIDASQSPAIIADQILDRST